MLMSHRLFYTKNLISLMFCCFVVDLLRIFELNLWEETDVPNTFNYTLYSDSFEIVIDDIYHFELF